METLQATQLPLMPDEVVARVDIGKPYCAGCGSTAVVVVAGVVVCVVCPAGQIQRELAQDTIERQRFAIARAQARGRSPFGRRRRRR